MDAHMIIVNGLEKQRVPGICGVVDKDISGVSLDLPPPAVMFADCGGVRRRWLRVREKASFTVVVLIMDYYCNDCNLNSHRRRNSPDPEARARR